MVSLRLLFGTSALTCFLAACTIVPAGADAAASTHSETTEGASGGATATSSHGGAGSKNSAQGGHAGQRSIPRESEAGSAGDADMESAAGTSSDPVGDAGVPPAPCDLDGNCASSCEAHPVTCGIVAGNECEFNGFIGATAEVSCGRRVAVGTACCGQCGCTPVEVYFDGRDCYQALSQCDGQLLNPHPPTVPNPSFTPNSAVQGSFYLGGAGAPGSDMPSAGGAASAGAFGMSAGEAGAGS